MAPTEVITHILDKDNYSKHQVVTLPNVDLPPLGESSIRFRTKILGLTTNNLTYARVGAFMGWYDIYPPPESTPAPYNDRDKYGRIAAWGYAEILGSTVPEIKTGHTIYGYLPISTGIETVRIEFETHNGSRIDDQIVVLDEHRQHVLKVYNRYTICPPLAELEKSPGLDSLGHDALMSALYGTAFNINRHVFAWETERICHPGGGDGWTAEHADLRNTVVIVLNASGKTGMSFAHVLRQDRPKEHQPTKIIGVGSQASVPILERSQLYDQVALNTDFEVTTAAIVKSNAKHIVFTDFGARKGATDSWVEALVSTGIPFTRVSIGAAPGLQDPEAAKARLANRDKLNLVNASALREKAIAIDGAKHFKEFERSFEKFKNTASPIKLVWGEGLEGWSDGWGKFCRDEIRADQGMVYRI